VRATDLCAGILFVAMGLLMIGLALTGRATYTPNFLLAFNRWGSDRLATLADRLSWIPDWTFALALIGLLLLAAFLVWPRRRGVAPAGAGHRIMPGNSDQHSGHAADTGHEGEAGNAAGARASGGA
jgi:membrane protein implicated in regulation of membrane protease activity